MFRMVLQKLNYQSFLSSFLTLFIIAFLSYGCDTKTSARKELEAKGITYSQESFINAVSDGNQSYVDLFIKAGIDVNAKNNSGSTPLLMAVDRKSLITVEKLLKNGADVDMKGFVDDRTPLFQAAVVGDKEIAALLISKGADVNIKNKSGIPVIWQAIADANKNFVELLIDKGAKVNITTAEGDTPLITAIQYDKKDIAELLISKGVGLEEKMGEYRITALIFAAIKGKKDIVELLINKGANLETKDKNNLTALIYAAIGGHYDTVKLLLDKGADRTVANVNGGTAYDAAMSKGHTEVASLLATKK